MGKTIYEQVPQEAFTSAVAEQEVRKTEPLMVTDYNMIRKARPAPTTITERAAQEAIDADHALPRDWVEQNGGSRP